VKKAGIFVHSRWPAAWQLADEVTSYLLGQGVKTVWVTSEWDDDALRTDMPGSDLLICLGGDGTVSLVVAGNHLESVAVYASGLIDLFGRQLHTLEVL